MSGYGKIFDSMFTGSMFGSGPVVISVWAYVISKTYGSSVELNPPFLAAMIGCEVAEVEAAIAVLTSPDPSSRSKEEEGRRLLHEDGFKYFVVNHEKYRDMVAAEQNRINVAAHRARAKEKAPAEPAKRFQPPSLEEVAARIAEMGYTRVSAEVFHSHYESNGWKVGKNKMKDWTKALGGWEARGKIEGGEDGRGPKPKVKQFYKGIVDPNEKYDKF